MFLDHFNKLLKIVADALRHRLIAGDEGSLRRKEQKNNLMAEGR